MKEEIKNLWVVALNSGEFNQEPSRLQSSTGHCCLGVLCEVAESQGIEVVREEDSIGELVGGNLDSQYPVKVWAEFRNPKVSPFRLMKMNDSGVSFKIIADFIKLNWKSL